MIVIAGKNEIAIHGLKLALQSFPVSDVLAVVNSTDAGHDGWQPSFLKFAKEAGVAIKTIKEIYDCELSVFLSLEFDKIVRVDRLRTDKVFNIHFSLLPKYKGMYTSVWPVLFNEKESGVTLHAIDSGIDTGAIYAQKRFVLDAEDRAQDCYRKYISASKELLSENFDFIINGFPAEPKLQAAEGATYFSKSTIDFRELAIDFKKCAWEVKRQIHAFGFRPYQFLSFHGKPVVNASILTTRSGAKPGEAVGEACFSGVTVSTIDYDIRLFFDGLDDFLAAIPNINVSELPYRLQGIAGVNDRNEKGWSPIIVAAYHGRLDIMRYLLQIGADVNDTNYKGTTVLMYAKDYALKSRDASIIDFLIASGADQARRDYQGKSIFEYISCLDAKFLGLTK
ncbi:formyl transferase [Pseudomonas argentinensis]|uniref:Methionyl-tRNA formyltransferase n=1 Tax=Phytopseudomonas argentinensis TaxID=289370 RepID=A0A1I3L062_9GAMM|nr:formyltransferase family protein [Pseudomonas argentinensis]KAB0550294.1 formyl transferase [Pseudomonas argentinensis]SFI78119.1 methionyl-tRNA formyltransferase [Pseudomonas argentinensis]